MKTYELFNPQIFGDMNTIFKSDDSLGAAKSFWTALSGYTNKEVPSFAFTLKNMEGGKLHHFTVNEVKSKKNKISFNIAKIYVSNDDEDILKNKIDLVKSKNFKALNGGNQEEKLDFEPDTDTDSDSDHIINTPIEIRMPNETCGYPFYSCLNKTYYNTPIFYLWYTPKVYTAYTNKTTFTTFLPSFIPPIHPYVELYTSYWYA